jgi:SSS family solute:Na+ symporter
VVLVALVYVPVTFLTEPDERPHLIKYYVMARPLGFWGPVRRDAVRLGLVTPSGDLKLEPGR